MEKYFMHIKIINVTSFWELGIFSGSGKFKNHQNDGGATSV